MNKKYQAIVIGGGYFGCSAAYHLAKSGVSTLLIEKDEITRGASGSNFGNVQVQDATMGLSLELTIQGFERMKHMEKNLGRKIGYRMQPSLIAAEKESHLPELEKLFREKKEAGLDIKWVEGKKLQEIEPNLAPGSVIAASYYEQGVIYPFHYMYALVGEGRKCGLEVLEKAPVSEILVEGGRCKGVILSTGETIHAEHVIVSAGGATRKLCGPLGLDVPVYEVKAESFVTEAIKPFMRTYYSSAAFFAEAHDLEKSATSLCISQSHFGNILLAETTKPYNMVKKELWDTTSIEHCENIRRRLIHFFPALRDIKILRSWVTPSPFTNTCLPCFGKSPIKGLILAAGFKSSVVLSAIVGEIISDLVIKDTCSYDLTEFMSQVKLG